MRPAHHPSEAILADYAGGALREAFAVVVAAHLEACPACRDHVHALEALGGDLVAQLPPTPLPDEALDRVMAGIERPLPPSVPVRPAVERIPFGWEIPLGPGMGVRKARLAGGDLLYRLRLPAGLRTIPHGHAGAEFTVVLKGAFQDDLGVYRAGDFAEMTEDQIDHQPAVRPGEECVCLIASERPMRVRSFFGHLIHAVTGV